MARRKRQTPNEATVVSLSFLDVFACTLGILLFIMLLAARQLTLTFDEKALRRTVENYQEKQNEVAQVLEKLGKQKQLREAWARIREQGGPDAVLQRAEQSAKQAETQLNELATNTPVPTSATIQQLQSQLAVLQRRQNTQPPTTRPDDTNRLSPSPFANLSPTRGTTVRPFVILVRPYDVVDLWNLRQIGPSNLENSAWRDFILDLSAGKGSVYPLLVVEPDLRAVELSERLAAELDKASVTLIGIEPFSSAWKPAIEEALNLMEGKKP